MIYDENEYGKIIDCRYAHYDFITCYKLVCENDFDTTSLYDEEQRILADFIEIGLKSKTEGESIQETKDLLQSYRFNRERYHSEKNYELLMNRIDSLSKSSGRSEDTVIKEHLVGTSEDDPIIQKISINS